MSSVPCPHCGSPVRVRGKRWECPWCGDFGDVSSLSPAGKAALQNTLRISLKLTVQPPEEPPSFSRRELLQMVARWDFSENPLACRDLLLLDFPEVRDHWSPEELEEMDTMDLLVEIGEFAPETALKMVKLLLDTAEDHLREEEAARQFLGWDMEDVLQNDRVLPLVVEQLEWDDRFGQQLFQSAYVGRVQEVILRACGEMGKRELQQKLLDLLEQNPFPHDPISLE